MWVKILGVFFDRLRRMTTKKGRQRFSQKSASPAKILATPMRKCK